MASKKTPPITTITAPRGPRLPKPKPQPGTTTDPVIAFDPSIGIGRTKSGKPVTLGKDGTLIDADGNPVGGSASDWVPPQGNPAAPLDRGQKVFATLPSLADSVGKAAVTPFSQIASLAAAATPAAPTPPPAAPSAPADPVAGFLGKTVPGAVGGVGDALAAALGVGPKTTVTRTTTSAPPRSPLQQWLEQILKGTKTSATGIPAGPTDAELLKQAQELAAAAYAPYESELHRQQDAAITDATKQADFQKGLYQALAEISRGVAPATQAAYREAGQDQSMMAKGFSDGLQMAAGKDTAGTNATLDMIGAPAAQRQTGDKAAAAGDVLYGLGGYIPGSTFAREGAAYGAAAAQLPYTSYGLGATRAADAMQAGYDAKSKLADQLKDLELKRGGDIGSTLVTLKQNRETNRNAAKQLAIQQAGVDQNNAMLPILLAGKFEGMPGIDPLTGLPTKTQSGIDATNRRLDIQAGNQQFQVAKWSASMQQWAQDHQVDVGKLALDQWKATHPKQAGITPKQVQDAKKEVIATAQEAWFGVKDKNGNFVHDPETYQQAMVDLVNVYGPQVGLTFIQNALNRYWTKAGYDASVDARKDGKFDDSVWVEAQTGGAPGSGRPKVPFQLRVTKKK